MTPPYATPQDAEDAFYEAFEGHDLEALMALWADSPQASCILPMGPLVQGSEAIRAAWEALFRTPQRPDITVHHRGWWESGDLAVHLVEEALTAPGMPPGLPPLIATNVFHHDGSGWRLVSHHVSPPPPPPGLAAGPQGP